MQQPPNTYPHNPQQQWQQPSVPPPEKKARKRLWLILAALVLVLAVIIGLVSHAQSQKPTPAAQPTHVTQQPALQPTSNPASKPTLQPTKVLTATHGTPQLGGAISDFIGTYGKPDPHSSIQQGYIALHFLPSTSSQSNVDGLIVATDPHNTASLAANITVQAQSGNAQSAAIGWAVNDAKTKCMAFAPSDAHFVKEFVYANTPGFDMVFTSAQLAKDFPASAFTDSQQKQVPAGTFDVQYLYAIDGQHISLCDLIIGEQQTTNNYSRNQ
ncbi:MAG TPA: hypothetical protein VIX20_08920 [Ktedonobacteraceae bacterium]